MMEDVVCTETFVSKKLPCRSFLFISTESSQKIENNCKSLKAIKCIKLPRYER